MNTTRQTGSEWEIRAEQWLRQKGLVPIEKNFNTRRGEIDLIMRDAGMLVFIEVRFRKGSRYGQAIETVTRQKQQKIIRAAELFLYRNPKLAELPCRFDVIGIEQAHSNQPADFNWLQNAFDLN